MSLAFEITEEDVLNVLRRNNVKADPAACLGLLDTGSIEKAALYGDDIDQQTEYAYQEIEKQLKDKGAI
jgi:hypothetical protein